MRDSTATTRVAVITLGTGIGSALFVNGSLVPNTELGHIQIRGKDAERRAAESVREREQLSWKQWAKRLNEYFAVIEALLWPDLIIIGGGVSKKSDKFFPLLKTRADLVAGEAAQRGRHRRRRGRRSGHERRDRYDRRGDPRLEDDRGSL